MVTAKALGKDVSIELPIQRILYRLTGRYHRNDETDWTKVFLPGRCVCCFKEREAETIGWISASAAHSALVPILQRPIRQRESCKEKKYPPSIQVTSIHQIRSLMVLRPLSRQQGLLQAASCFAVSIRASRSRAAYLTTSLTDLMRRDR